MTSTSAPGVSPTALPGAGGLVPFTDQPRQAFVEQIMGLPISVHLRGPRARSHEAAGPVGDLFAALRADDELFSTWKPDSAVSRIRRGALSLEDAGPRLRQAAGLCEEAARRTGGSFSAWLPGADGDTRFDPTGLVKGWSVEQAFGTLVARLASLGPHDVLISAGGDVIVSCTRTDTPDWVIGVEDPRDRTRTLLSIPLRSGAVATSGTAARGKHILDPSTGAPPSGLLSATIVGPSLVWADVYATAAFVRGPDAATWLASLGDHAAVLVDTQGEAHVISPRAG